MEAKENVKVEYNAVCSKCKGYGGTRNSEECPTCAGTGFVLVKKLINITIEPAPNKPKVFINNNKKQ